MGHGLLGSLVCLGATLAGPFIFFAGFRAMRIRQLIQNTPTSRIRSMAMGLAEVSGGVLERSRVSAPFSGKPCAYWEVEIATRSSNRNGTRSWSTVHHNRSSSPFFIKDDTGTALVYPHGADCRLPFGVEETTHGFGVPDCYMQYMEQHKLHMRGMWALGPMRFRERVLEDGQVVYVLGRVFPRAQSANVSWDEPQMEATGTEGMVTSRLRTLDADVRGVFRKGEHDPVFLISPRSEKTMTLEYGLQAAAGLVLGPLVTLFGLWCLLEMLKSRT